jgi:hypothetical protein
MKSSVLAVVFAVAAWGAAVGPAFAMDNDNGEAALRAANAAEVDAILAGDESKLSSLWADTFVVTNPFNKFVTKTEVLALMNSGVFRFSSMERAIDYIHTYGDVAVVAGSETGVWAGNSPMTGKLSHFRFTTVWRRAPGGWVEVARHANMAPPASPGS